MDNLMGSNESRKREILEKSRKAKKDEGMENADYQGSKIGVTIYAVVAFFLVVFSISDNVSVVYAIASLSFTWVIGGTLSYYRFTKRKIFLVCVVASAIAMVAFAFMTIIQ